MVTEGKPILITGISSGIGLDTAMTLSQNPNYRVFGTVRNTSDLSRVTELSQGKITSFLMDVTDDGSVIGGFEALKQHTETLYAVVNNAGIVVGGPVECLPLDQLKMQMDVNYFGVIRVLQQAIPLLRAYTAAAQEPKTSKAKIINISSIAGLSPLPFVSPYSASKHAIESMSDALRVELAPWQIDVSLIEPGAVKTPIWEKSLNSAQAITGEVDAEKIKLYEKALARVAEMSQKSGARGIEPSEVTKAIINALESHPARTRYLLGKDAKLRQLSRRLPDRWQDWVIQKKLGIYTKNPTS